MDFSERFCSLRAKTGLSQKQLADKLHISKSAVSSYENKNAVPSIEIIKVIANYFDVSIDYLLCETEYPKRIDGNKVEKITVCAEHDRLELANGIIDLLGDFDIKKKK